MLQAGVGEPFPGTQVIVPTERDATYTLDEILGNTTELPVTEHATDTHGQTLLTFALFDLVGLQLSPRIANLAGQAQCGRTPPMRVTRAQLGTLAGFKVTGGTFQTYFSTLKRHGLIEDQGGEISITAGGFDHLGEVAPAPMTTQEIIERWRKVLKAGARAMLDVLIEIHPDSMARAELAEAVDMTVTGGTFQTYLSTLRRNGLVEFAGDGVRASETLFMGEP